MGAEYDLTKRLFDSELGPPGDFGSGVADALAVRKAYAAGINHKSIDAFDAVMAQAPTTEARLRFAALVSDLTAPAPRPGAEQNVFRLALNGLAGARFAQEIKVDPTAAFRTIITYPDYFCESGIVANAAERFTAFLAARLPEGEAKDAARKARTYIALSCP